MKPSFAEIYSTFVPIGLMVATTFAEIQYSGNGETPQYWKDLAKYDLLKFMAPNIDKQAKNVILFIGDGMSPSTVNAARILNGQLQGKTGEETFLSWERFLHTGLSKTYNQDFQTPDSAGTATAFLCGVKTNKGVLGVDGRVERGNCATLTDDTKLTSIIDWSKAAGKSVGFVTTTRVTHATPAAGYANVPDRKWESDKYIPEGSTCAKDIARQLIEDNSDIQVILGGGRQNFMKWNQPDPERGSNEKTGRRDGRDLIEDWKTDKRNKNKKYHYVWNLDDFKKVDPSQTDFLLGLFEQDHMNFDIERTDPDVERSGEPSLAEMTGVAIKILEQNPSGYFLLVEGGRIDKGHHLTKAGLALHDTIALAKAVEIADELTNEQETLIVVTADHGHSFAMTGYPTRGNPILGKVDDGNGGFTKAGDGKPYTTIVYGNGPGFPEEDSGRANIAFTNTSENHYIFQSAVPRSSETHSGEDVPIYGRGPMSHLLTGVHEQHYIAHVMAYASCVGEYTGWQHCAKTFPLRGRNGETRPDTSLIMAFLLPIEMAILKFL